MVVMGARIQHGEEAAELGLGAVEGVRPTTAMAWVRVSQRTGVREEEAEAEGGRSQVDLKTI
jgi:hypothetical protein